MLEINLTYNRFYSLLMYDAKIPLISRVELINLGKTDVLFIKTVISVTFGAAEMVSEINGIAAGKASVIIGTDILPSRELLCEIETKRPENIKITVYSHGNAVLERSFDVELISKQTWLGLDNMPELIPMYIKTEDSYIAELVEAAKENLCRWQGYSKFTGYRDKSLSAISQISAVYDAVCAQKIELADSADLLSERIDNIRNFNDIAIQRKATPLELSLLFVTVLEAVGLNPILIFFDRYVMRIDNIRNFNDIAIQRKATPLELSLLFVTVLEAVGLNPILIFFDRYVMVACWTVDNRFGEFSSEDLQRLVVRAASGVDEMCILDIMGLFAGDEKDFEDSAAIGMQKVLELQSFNSFLDIKTARHLLAEDKSSFVTADTVQQQWEKNLKNLSMMDQLLNFNPRRNSLQLMIESAEALPEVLARGEFVLLEGVQDFAENLYDDGFYRTTTRSTKFETIAMQEAQEGRLRTFVSNSDMQEQLDVIGRRVFQEIHESGVNTLYVGIGMLKWFDSNLSTTPRFSPLIFMPIVLSYSANYDRYIIELCDESKLLNLALIELLNDKYGIDLSNAFENYDVRTVFSTIRDAVSSKQGWIIEDHAVISIFNFNELILWNDYRNREAELLANPIIATMANNARVRYGRSPIPSKELVENSLANRSVVVPMSMDYSQLSAVFAVATGESFVVHGPPGTGKSQTIAGSIASAMYTGKSVLFVSEKAQALLEVQRRISELGLGGFCLSLHSGYVKKSEFIKQLTNSVTMELGVPEESFSELSLQLSAVRRKLEFASSEFSRPRLCGISIYDAILMCEENFNAPDAIWFNEAELGNITENALVDWEKLIAELTEIAASTTPEELLSLAEAAVGSFSDADIKECKKAINSLNKACDFFANTLKFSQISSYRQIEAAIKLCKIIAMGGRNIDRILLADVRLANYKEMIDSVLKAIEKKTELYTQISGNFSLQVLNIDASSAFRELSHLSEKDRPRHRIARFIRNLSKDPASVDSNTILDIVKQIADYNNSDEILKKNNAVMNQLFGDMWNSGNCDWSMIRAVFNSTSSLQSILGIISSNSNEYAKILGQVQLLLDSDDARLKKVYKDFTTGMYENILTVLGYEHILVEKLGVDGNALRAAENWTEAIETAIEETKAAYLSDTDVDRYTQLRLMYMDTPIVQIFGILERGILKPEELRPAYLRALGSALVRFFMSQSADLIEFDGLGFENQILNLGLMIERYKEAAVAEIYTGLTENLRVVSHIVANETNFLQHVLINGGDGLSVKDILDGIPTLSRAMFPCFMMTPSSVAQYIGELIPKFDVVIFDEASQTSTARAIGAISRGQSLVVVGDTMQLPPCESSGVLMFNDTLTDRDMDTSLLDDCVRIGMYEHLLKLHYRSYSERLISFSNNMYYGGRIYTLPVPVRNDKSIELVRVSGTYDRANTLRNETEAKAVVAEVVRRLSDSELRKESIIIIAFNSEQKLLIEDLLIDTFNKDDELKAYAYQCHEPLLVRSADNTQGYERDVAIVSVCFGRDTNGDLSFNMGSLIRDNGYKRLNTALTRARYKLIIFTSLDADTLELSRTTIKAMYDLNSFIHYAETNILPHPDRVKMSSRTGFEEIVANALRARGYNVETMIGMSGFKVDIAVVNPKNPDEYILAILCDSIRTNEDISCYDRYILQDDILTRNGWNVMRIWPLEWIKGQNIQVDRIVEQIERLAQ